MRSKHVLIVDDEASVRTILKGALRKLGKVYEVVTASDGFSAIDKMKERTFDLVVTDFNMSGMDGLELIETIRYQQPQAKIIMITAYGYDGLEEDAEKLKVYRYLAKPLEIDDFRQVVKEALAESASTRPNIFMVTDDQFATVHTMLKQLQVDVSARCIFLTDPNGHTIARIGDAGTVPVEELASLLGGGIATLVEAGRVLDGDMNAINLTYRESKNEYLYAINIGQRLLLILIIDRGQYSSRLGSVWYYAQRAAIDLDKTLSSNEGGAPNQVFNESINKALDAELDKLFM